MPTDWLGIDWLTTWTAVYALATVAMVVVVAISATVGLTAYRREQLDRRYQVLKDLSTSWESDQLVEARWKINLLGDRLSEALIRTDQSNDRDYYTLIRVDTFFEDAAILGIAGVISLEDVRGLFGIALIERYFNLYEPYIKHEQSRQPRLFSKFRVLATGEANG